MFILNFMDEVLNEGFVTVRESQEGLQDREDYTFQKN